MMDTHWLLLRAVVTNLCVRHQLLPRAIVEQVVPKPAGVWVERGELLSLEQTGKLLFLLSARYGYLVHIARTRRNVVGLLAFLQGKELVSQLRFLIDV